MSVPVSCLAILQKFGLLGARPLVDRITGSHIFSTTTLPSNVISNLEVARATGPFPHWHNLAGYLLMIGLLCVALLLSDRELVSRPLVAVCLAPLLIALVQTASIAPILGVLAGSIAIGLFMKRARLVIHGLAIVVVVSLVFFGSTFQHRYQEQYSVTQEQVLGVPVPSTIAFRFAVWRDWTPVVEKNLLLGYGPRTPPNVFYGLPESFYVQILVLGGIPLLFLWCLLSFSLGSWALRAFRLARDEVQPVVGSVVVTAMVVLAFIHIIAPYLRDVGATHVLWVLAGLLSPAAGLSMRPRDQT
jgi:O-Antigen ligase